MTRQTANPKFKCLRTFAKRASSRRVIDWGGQPRNTPSSRSLSKGIAGSKCPISRKSMTLTGVLLASAIAESCSVVYADRFAVSLTRSSRDFAWDIAFDDPDTRDALRNPIAG